MKGIHPFLLPAHPVCFFVRLFVKTRASTLYILNGLRRALRGCVLKSEISPGECDIPVPGIPATEYFSFFGGIGTGIRKKWYQKKSLNQYRKNLVPELIYNGYQYQEFFLFLVVSEPVSEKFGNRKSLVTGIGKNLVTEQSL